MPLSTGSQVATTEGGAVPTLLERAARIAFWIGAPLAVAGLLFWPRGSVIVVRDAPFSLEINPVRSTLPSPLSDLLFFYPATILALGVLLACTSARHWRWLAVHRREVWLPTFFLPTCLAGMESTGLITWSMRCHSVTSPLAVRAILFDGAVLSAGTLVLTTVLGGLSALAWGHRSRIGLRVPPVVGAIVAAVAMQWCVLLRLVVPR